MPGFRSGISKGAKAAGFRRPWDTPQDEWGFVRRCGTARLSGRVLLQSSSSIGEATTLDNKRETVSLIGSDKVEGTAVYGADERKIGSVQRIMIDKISGEVAYAVVSFGGFLGMGEDYYPMPWPNLKYDTRLDGYRVGVTEDQLKGGGRKCETSFHHQPEAQHPKSSAIHKIAGRLPHLTAPRLPAFA